MRTHLLPSFADVPVEDITVADCEHWRAQLGAGGTLNNRTKVKIMTVFFGVMERARKTYKLPLNPVRDLEKPIQRRRIDIQVFSPEEVMALVRAADSEQDAAIFLTAAFTGLRRGELVALRWRDVDFARSHVRVRASYTEGELTDAQVRPDPRGADGARRRHDAGAADASASTGPATTTSSSPARAATTSTPRRCTGATSWH